MMRFHCASESDSSAPVSGLSDAGIVDQRADLPEMLRYGLDAMFNRGLIADIHLEERAACIEFRLARVPLSIEHRHVEITRGKAPRDGRADTLCAAGHDNASTFHQDSPRDGRYGSKKANRCRLAFVQFRGT